jgi:hypothetical protein
MAQTPERRALACRARPRPRVWQAHRAAQQPRRVAWRARVAPARPCARRVRRDAGRIRRGRQRSAAGPHQGGGVGDEARLAQDLGRDAARGAQHGPAAVDDLRARQTAGARGGVSTRAVYHQPLRRERYAAAAQRPRTGGQACLHRAAGRWPAEAARARRAAARRLPPGLEASRRLRASAYDSQLGVMKPPASRGSIRPSGSKLRGSAAPGGRQPAE